MERLIDGMENDVREYVSFCGVLYVSLHFKPFSYQKLVMIMLFKHYKWIFDRFSAWRIFNFPIIEYLIMRRNCGSFFVLSILMMNGRITYDFWENSSNSSWFYGMKILLSIFIIMLNLNINFLLKITFLKGSDRTWIRHDDNYLYMRIWIMGYLQLDLYSDENWNVIMIFFDGFVVRVKFVIIH